MLPGTTWGSSLKRLDRKGLGQLELLLTNGGDRADGGKVLTDDTRTGDNDFVNLGSGRLRLRHNRRGEGDKTADDSGCQQLLTDGVGFKSLLLPGSNIGTIGTQAPR